MRVSNHGMTILEVMLAMVVLAVALVGSLAAMQQGNVELKLGQTRQQKLLLGEAVLERERLMDKTAFFNPATPLPTQPSVDLNALAVGASPWQVDPVAPSADPNDLSTGAYFNVGGDGSITRATGITPGTTCNAVPVGTICREVYTHRGTPYNSTNVTGALAAGSNVATTWVRVTRRPGPNFPAEVDLTLTQVLIQ